MLLATIALSLLPLSPSSEHRIALHCVGPARPTHHGVLFIHGATFPTRLASGYRFAPADSWLDFAAGQGSMACGLDFLGFGASTRPASMLQAADRAPPLVRADEAALQIGVAVDHMRKTIGMATVHLVAHSWGTIPAAAFAAKYPAQVRSLTLFGPVVPVPEQDSEPQVTDAWFPLVAQERREQLRFKAVLPPGISLLDPAVNGRWAMELAASAPKTPSDAAGVLRVPLGPAADIGAAMVGSYPYAAKDVRVPVFVVYGNYDVVVNDDTASAFLAAFTASPLKWRMRIDPGTHVMHLERARTSLYESVAAFIRAADHQRQ
jgi:pimeloyl-ACP methyl ester carboxylesterase